MVELEIARVPPLLNAPPLNEEAFAPETVTPEMVRLPPDGKTPGLAMLKMLKSRFGLLVPEELSKPLIIREEAPGPVMVRVPAEVVEAMVGRDCNTLSRVIVPVTLKSIISLAEVPLAVVMASLKEVTLGSESTVSAVVVTVIVAGTILPSSWRSWGGGRIFVLFYLVSC